MSKFKGLVESYSIKLTTESKKRFMFQYRKHEKLVENSKANESIIEQLVQQVENVVRNEVKEEFKGYVKVDTSFIGRVKFLFTGKF